MTERFRPEYPDVPSMNQAVREYTRQRQMGIGDLLLGEPHRLSWTA